MKLSLAALVGWLLAATASASEYSGLVLTIRTAASPETSGNTRVSVQIQGTTSCSFAGWYSFDFGTNGPGKQWFAQLLEAKASGRALHIVGTGTCDTSGLEKIYYIDTP